MRLLFGLTQEELAGLAGISRPSLVNYEQGGYSPIDDILLRLAELFWVEPGYLRYGAPPVNYQVWKPNVPKHSQRKQNLIDEIEKLFPDFLEENSFSGVVVGKLADGGYAFLFGRDNHYDCLLIADQDICQVVQKSSSGLKAFHVDCNKSETVDTFDVNCLTIMHQEISKLDLQFELNEMRQSLTHLLTIKAKSVTNLDAVSLEYAAKNDKVARDRLLKVADTICRELVGGGISLDELILEQKQKQYLPTLDVSAYSDPVSKTLCVILKAAYDVLAAEQKMRRSFPQSVIRP